jgi:uncharacterized protein
MSNSDRRERYNLECRDPVHGFVYLSKAEWAIVDCPTFQRLRDIRQLAMAHLVYPGATHTRFEHSLGCLHLSDLIYRAIGRQVDQGACPDFGWAFRKSDEKHKRGRQLLRLASLLHDVGHTPFSHTGENLMPEVTDDGKKRRITHEDMTARLIRETEISRKLDEQFGEGTVEEVVALATKPEWAKLPNRTDLAWYRFLNDIITGELGSDRMDYLLRDAMHSGQSVGVIDYRKLIDSMTIVPPAEEAGEEEHRLGLDGAGWLLGEQLVVARYLMYVALYFHKTKRIYELHLEDFIGKWLESQFKQPFFPVNNIDTYRRLTDSAVWAAIYDAANGSDEPLKRLAAPFVDRTHLRLAFELLLADNFIIPVPGAFSEFAEKLLKRLEGSQAASMTPEKLVGAWDESFVTILRRRHPRVWDESRFDKLVEAVNNVRYKFGSTRSDQPKHHAVKFFEPKSKISVYVDGKTRYLDELSEIVSGMPERIWRGRIYGPEQHRDEIKSFCEQWLRDNPAGGGSQDASK